jgi:hypothetical protein
MGKKNRWILHFVVIIIYRISGILLNMELKGVVRLAVAREII